MFNRTSAPGGSGPSRTQLLGYLGGGALLVLALVEVFAPDLLDVIGDPQVAIAQALTLLGLGFARRAIR